MSGMAARAAPLEAALFCLAPPPTPSSPGGHPLEAGLGSEGQGASGGGGGGGGGPGRTAGAGGGCVGVRGFRGSEPLAGKREDVV